MFHIIQMKAQLYCTSMLIRHITHILLKDKDSSFIHRKPEYLYGHNNLHVFGNIWKHTVCSVAPPDTWFCRSSSSYLCKKCFLGTHPRPMSCENPVPVVPSPGMAHSGCSVNP